MPLSVRLDSLAIRAPDAVYRRLISLGATDPNNRPEFLCDYVDEVYRLAPLVNLSPDWIITQAALETGHPVNGLPPFVSPIWRSRGNPAGIGVTDKYDYGFGFSDGATAARAHIVHLYGYVHGRDDPDPDIAPYIDLDPRWDVPQYITWAGSVVTVDDLAGKWATDPNYGIKLRDRFAVIIEGADASPEDTAMPRSRPYVIISAGHRSTQDPGNPTEKARTDDLARAYTDAFRKAGFRADWFQRDLDHDRNPDQTIGSLATVAVGVRKAVEAAPEKLVIAMELHYDGGHSVVHTIVPDNVGLRSAMAGGDIVSDTAANNTLDVALAQQISMNITYATGLGIYGGARLGKLGVMSERDTGVAQSGNWRLGFFGGTAPVRMKAVRLIIEHAGWADSETLKPGFEERCAAAAVEAVNTVLELEPPIEKPEEPEEPEAPEPPVLDYPAGMNRAVATRLFDQATGDDGRIYGFDERGPVSNLWLETGKRTSHFPALTGVWNYDDGDGHWRKYFIFSGGLVILDTDTSGLTIVGAPDVLTDALDNVLNPVIDNSK